MPGVQVGSRRGAWQLSGAFFDEEGELRRSCFHDYFVDVEGRIRPGNYNVMVGGPSSSKFHRILAFWNSSIKLSLPLPYCEYS